MMNNELRSYESYIYTGMDWLEVIPAHWEKISLRGITELSNSRCGIRNDLELLSVYREYGVVRKNSRDDNHNVESLDLSNYKYVDKGYLVLNKMKMWQGSLGISKYEGIVSPAYIVCKIKGNINFDYLHLLLRSPKYKTIYNRISYGVRVGQWDMRYDDFKKINLFIPPKSEQDQIVRYLDHQLAKINKFINAKKKLIAVFKEQIECYVYGNDAEFSEDINSWETSFPKEWKMIKASRLTKEKNIKNKGEYELLAVTQDRGVVFKKDCEQNYVSPAGDLSGLKLVSDGDYVISLRSFQGGIEFSNVEGIVSPAYNIFSLVNDYESEEYKHYYKQLFKTKAFISLLNTVVSGIRDGKNINYSDFVKLLLPVPPQNVANKVYKLSLKIDKMQNEFNAEFALLKEFRDALISNVVTGNVDVRNIIIEELEEEIIEDIELDDEAIDEEILEEEDGDE